MDWDLAISNNNKNRKKILKKLILYYQNKKYLFQINLYQKIKKLNIKNLTKNVIILYLR